MTEWNAELYRERSTLQQTMAAEVLQSLDLTSSERVLDVGCGDGRITFEIARRVPQGSVVGVDASSNMIELASQKSGSNLRFEVADARSLPFRDQFDLVLSFNAFHWVHEQDLVLASIHKSLRPGGTAHLRLVPMGPARALRPFSRRHGVRQHGSNTFASFTIRAFGRHPRNIVRSPRRADFESNA